MSTNELNKNEASVKNLHFNQIPLQKDIYIDLLKNNSSSIANGLINCIHKKGTKEYKSYLLVVSSRLYELGRLVYVADNRYSKLVSDEYENILFNYLSDYQDEYENRTNMSNYDRGDDHFDFRSIELLKKSISYMISETKELIYMSEWAGIIDFIVTRNNDLPNPEFISSMFVSNWDGYDPVENDITREFMDNYGLY